MYFTPVFSSVYLFCIVARLPLSFYIWIDFSNFSGILYWFSHAEKRPTLSFDSREHRYDCDFLFSMSPLYRLALFYQPFSPTKLILLLAVIYLIPQVMGIFWARIFTQKKQNINIFKQNIKQGGDFRHRSSAPFFSVIYLYTAASSDTFKVYPMTD